MITIPEVLWSRMLDEFGKERRSVEQVGYIDGVVFQDNEKCLGVATTLTFPNAKLEAGRFEVPAAAMSEAGKHFRKFRLQRLAQVHTHPTDWTGHSPWDDEWAYSQVPGAISIVLPDYARRRPALEDAGVHLRTKQGWRQLNSAEVEERLRVVPAYLDFRKGNNHEQRIKSPRRRPWWKALAFWFHEAPEN